MQEVNINELIEKLSKRNDDGASKEFMEMLCAIIGVYKWYKEWAHNMIKKNGTYHGCKTDLELLERFKRSIELIENIEKNGVKEPIHIYREKEGIEIDGYHRLIISHVLGKDTICIK